MLEFKIPEVGENISSGTVVTINVSVGDSVSKEQDLLELETDKATIPVPSPVDGTISEILISEGDEVQIGQIAFKIDGASNQSSSEAPEATAETKESAPVASSTSASTPPPVAKQAAAPVTRAVQVKSNEAIAAQKDVPAAPSVRRLARELGLEISIIPGTALGGRISKDDVKAYAKGIILSGGASAPVKESRPLPDFSKWGNVKREAMNNIRKKTATHLHYCWETIPHVTQFDKADITEIDKLRKEKSTDKLKLTITPFLLKIMANALKEFPQFNCSIDMDTKEIIYKDYYNLGVAVDTERGLLVPIVRDIDKKDIFEIGNELNEMAERARNKKTQLDELQGGSMTLTNLGGIGGTMFTPIVNWPEVAILGISRGGFEPVYDKTSGEFTPRFKLPLSLSYDHRIIDGADGARFLRWICNALEQPFEI